MKKNIHPKYYPQAKVVCACGNTFYVGSTVPEIRVEICSQCHPFFTGEMKYVDTMGKVEKFQRRMKIAQQLARQKKSKKQKNKKPVIGSYKEAIAKLKAK